MRRSSGFSLVELVIVVLIIGLIAAIALPRFGSAADGASDSAVAANLRMLRQAIDAYQAEHDGVYPALAQFEAQLTRYTNSQGTSSAATSPAAPFGPYLRQIPPFKSGRSNAKLGANTSGGVDWVYDETDGKIYANGGGNKDLAGRLYTDY